MTIKHNPFVEPLNPGYIVFEFRHQPECPCNENRSSECTCTELQQRITRYTPEQN